MLPWSTKKLLRRIHWTSLPIINQYRRKNSLQVRISESTWWRTTPPTQVTHWTTKITKWLSTSKITTLKERKEEAMKMLFALVIRVLTGKSDLKICLQIYSSIIRHFQAPKASERIPAETLDTLKERMLFNNSSFSRCSMEAYKRGKRAKCNHIYKIQQRQTIRNMRRTTPRPMTQTALIERMTYLRNE